MSDASAKRMSRTFFDRAGRTLADIVVLAELEQHGRLTLGQLAERVVAVGPMRGAGEPTVVASVERLAHDGAVKVELGTVILTDAGRRDLAEVQSLFLSVLAAETPTARWPADARPPRSSGYLISQS